MLTQKRTKVLLLLFKVSFSKSKVKSKVPSTEKRRNSAAETVGSNSLPRHQKFKVASWAQGPTVFNQSKSLLSELVCKGFLSSLQSRRLTSFHSHWLKK